MTDRRGEDGQALIEALLIGLVLIVPVIWLLAVLAGVHKGALAATAAAREAGFEAARSPTVTEAERAVASAVAGAFADQGLGAGRVDVQWSASGLERGGLVEVEVAYPVAVARFPFIGGFTGPSVWVRARHVARVDPFRSRP